MRSLLCRTLVLASCALPLSLTSAMPLPSTSGWVNTGQVLTCPDSIDRDHFPAAMAAIPGKLLVSDVWPRTSSMSDTHLARLRTHARNFFLPDETATSVSDPAMGSYYRFTQDSKGHFNGELITSLFGRLFGNSLAQTKDSELVGTPDLDRVFRFLRSGDEFLSDHYFSDPEPLHIMPQFGNSIDSNGQWLAIGARSQGIGSPGAVYLYSWNGKDWDNHPQKLEPAHRPKHFGDQLKMQGNQLLVSTAPYLNDNHEFWYQSVYVYQLNNGTWELQGDPIVQTIPDGNHTVATAILNDRVLMSGYDLIHEQNLVNSYQLKSGKWVEVQTLMAPKGSSDFGYNLQVAEKQLLISQRTPQNVLVYKTDDKGNLVSTGTAIANPDPDKRPGFANRMAYDGKNLFIATQGSIDDSTPFKGKIFVYNWGGDPKPTYPVYDILIREKAADYYLKEIR